ncbi:hypothetical protein Ddc_14486 [Ditylenchus destructor]|nr:hypothetical protein Ddc_14486 [Ditylenchus destructor]
MTLDNTTPTLDNTTPPGGSEEKKSIGDDFKASEGWLEKFKRRNSITFGNASVTMRRFPSTSTENVDVFRSGVVTMPTENADGKRRRTTENVDVFRRRACGHNADVFRQRKTLTEK